jgi:hypothetical protein
VIKESSHGETKHQDTIRFLWGGNRLLSETRHDRDQREQTRTTIYEPNSFVPMVRLDEIVQPKEPLPALPNEMDVLGYRSFHRDWRWHTIVAHGICLFRTEGAMRTHFRKKDGNFDLHSETVVPVR